MSVTHLLSVGIVVLKCGFLDQQHQHHQSLLEIQIGRFGVGAQQPVF